MDVLIVPPLHGPVVMSGALLYGPSAWEATPLNTYAAAARNAAESWETAVGQFGSSALINAFIVNAYVLGSDTVPEEALTDPEILVVPVETLGPALYGASVDHRVITHGELPGKVIGPCDPENPFCDEVFIVPQLCVAYVTMFHFTSASYEFFFNTVAHEVGHCLGLHHAQGTSDDMEHDTMQRDAQHIPVVSPFTGHDDWWQLDLHCPSSMNVAGLELVFAPALGQPGGDSVTISSAAYDRSSCGSVPALWNPGSLVQVARCYGYFDTYALRPAFNMSGPGPVLPFVMGLSGCPGPPPAP